jgi:tol-pal system protein YbgF
MKRILLFCLPFCLTCFIPTARAGTSEEIMRLQSDVLALQKQIREFEKIFNERTDGLKSLVVQLNDEVSKSNLILDRVAKTLESQAAGTRSNDQSLRDEVHNISLKMDDTATRLSALAQQVNDLKIQAKAMATEPAPNSALMGQQSVYDQAYSDYVQANFDLAVQGFTDYLRNNPAGDRTAAAQFYLGDSYAQQGKVPQAIAAFTRVINDFPGAEQAASALYKRGRVELGMKESDNAIADFRAVIEKFPAAPEAERAKDELRKLGASITKPAPASAPRRKSR